MPIECITHSVSLKSMRPYPERFKIPLYIVRSNDLNNIMQELLRDEIDDDFDDNVEDYQTRARQTVD